MLEARIRSPSEHGLGFALRELVGGEVRLVAEKKGLVAVLRGDSAGMLKLAAPCKNIKENNWIYKVVAGAGFEPTTFGL